jgi:uncharacterized protein (TIGR03382 family)
MSGVTKAMVVLFWIMLVPGAARAQSRWIDGNFGFVSGLACVTWNLETEVTTYAGSWGALDASYPKTGDVTYVHAVAGVVGNPCSGGDVIGFDFFLPTGASVAVSAQNPVRCVATRLSDGFTTTTDPAIHCSQTASPGTAGGLFFGYAVTPHGWLFEIQVPVRFDKVLHGLASPPTERLGVITSSTNGPRAVEAFVTVPLRAIVNYPAPSATYQGIVQGAAQYRLVSFIYNYFTAGTAVLDVGFASGNYSNPGLAPAQISSTANGFQVAIDLGLAPAYTGNVFWRTRFVTAAGATFTGPEQSFTANGQNAQIHALTVTKAGSASGAVTSDPQGLDCTATCTQSFTAGTQVTLHATPGPGAQFTGWGGACSGAGACTIAMTAATAVTATFGPLPVATIGTLEIVPDGLPVGGIASISVTGPGGFTRTFDLPSGIATSLSDVAPGQYDGVAAAVVVGADTWVPRPARPSAPVVAGGKGVISTTYRLGRALTVAKTGAGTVTSSPAGVACGSTCSAHFADGEAVTLTPVPDAGMMFTGWTGGCTGQATCVVTLTAAASVAAAFAPVPGGGGGSEGGAGHDGCSAGPPGDGSPIALVLAGLVLAHARRRKLRAGATRQQLDR